MKELILVGGGGHCKSCIDVVEHGGEFHIAGIVDVKEKLHQQVLGYEIIGTDEDLPALAQKYDHYLITVGQIKSPAVRIRLFSLLKELQVNLPTIISPIAYVSAHARLGEGTIVMHRAMINAGTTVGVNCIINTKSLLEHDVVIGDHCHVATGALINGGVQVGDGTFVGSGAVCREYTTISKNSVIGCNTTIK